MTVEARYNRKLLVYPPEGRLLVCTDLHGHLEDFRTIREKFFLALTENPDTYILFTGDLIHGPAIHPHDWEDEILGDYYFDQSGDLMAEFSLLKQDHPDRVHCLLGNHEHSHIGGPHTGKFHRDETVFFEDSVGREMADQYNKFFNSFSLIAVTQNRIVFTHGAPRAKIHSLDRLSRIDYEDCDHIGLRSMAYVPILGELIWSRSATDEEAQAFLEGTALEEGRENWVSVYGHDVAREGVEKRSSSQMVVSTSFGLVNSNKRYLDLDLAGSYKTVDDFREGVEILRLYTEE